MKSKINICLILISLLAFEASNIANIYISATKNLKYEKKCCCSLEKHQNLENTCKCCSGPKKQTGDSNSKSDCEKKSCHCSSTLQFTLSFFTESETLKFSKNISKPNFSFITPSPQTVFLATWQPPKLS
jgi:hypothetical protein